MMLMDTTQEREINLGDRYKFRPLKQGECWVNYQMAASLYVEEGHAIQMKINMYQNLIYLAGEYNKRANVPSNQKINIEDLSQS
jgi:hypothetical protein